LKQPRRWAMTNCAWCCHTECSRLWRYSSGLIVPNIHNTAHA
jgi:hypothetical protein